MRPIFALLCLSLIGCRQTIGFFSPHAVEAPKNFAAHNLSCSIRSDEHSIFVYGDSSLAHMADSVPQVRIVFSDYLSGVRATFERDTVERHRIILRERCAALANELPFDLRGIVVVVLHAP